jgi:hypothetical protein
LPRQPTHTFVVVLQTGVAPEQLPLERHCTHVAVEVSQMGVVPPHRPRFVAEHAPHAPLDWQAGAVPGHWASDAQGPHVCVDAEQTGVVPEQFEPVRQATQMRGDADVRQYGVAPPQSEFETHFSAKTSVVCMPVVAPSPSDR